MRFFGVVVLVLKYAYGLAYFTDFMVFVYLFCSLSPYDLRVFVGGVLQNKSMCVIM